MKNAWKSLAQRIDSLNVRERIFVFVGAAAVLAAAAFTIFIDPAATRAHSLTREILQKQAQANALQEQITALLQGHRIDPNAAARSRLQALQDELAGLDREIAGEERKFTSPSQMRGVIAEMLARNRGVKLVDLKTLPVSTIEDPRAGAAEKSPAKPAADRRVYRHGMELTVTGGYLDLLAYVADLERLPTQLYWGALDMDASAYPRLAMKLTVYTLSLERAWMNV